MLKEIAHGSPETMTHRGANLMSACVLSRVRYVALLAVLVVLPHSARTDTSPGEKSIAAALQPYVQKHALAGVVTLVADKNKVLDVEAVGYADFAQKKPMRTDALFWIASQSKPITATALLTLVDDGKVKLDDPAEKYLPELRDLKVAVGKGKERVLKKPEHPVTVRNLLSHTSGMPFSSAKERPTLDVLSLKDAVLSYAETPLLFEPGSSYQYSNAGINTAGRIIEVVSGMSYESFLDKKLFGPLGMKDTTFWPDKEQLKRLAKSYRPNKEKTGLEEIKIGQLKYPLDDRERRPMPAGGLFSTAADVARFCQMLLNGGTLEGKRYVSEAAVKEMTSKQTGALKQAYGLGWATGGEWFGHGGAHATNMIINRKTGLIMVWMVQHAGFPYDGGKAQGVFQRAAQERFGKTNK
jgi:CubicO group peptidase (beta-lactamase class C family)